MASNSPVDGLTEEEYEFIAAVIEDENYEFDISDDGEYSLFTDWEGDGHFFPSITIMHEVNDDEKQAERDRIDSLLSKFNWFTYNEIDDIEVDRQSGLSHAYFYNEEIDEDVREKVAETL